MRHQYTPIFRDVLTSRVWALPDAHLRVWLWLQLQADPEGCVCADLAGVALGARVSAQDARGALTVLALADADADPSDVNEGRLIVRVPGGWQVLGVDERRSLAKREGQKARNRKYMQGYRARVANDTEPTESPLPSTVDAPKPKPKPLSSEGEDPPTPLVVEDPPTELLAPTRTIHAIPATWQPSGSLRAEAAIAGVSKLDEHVASLRTGPVGGARGLFESALDDYVRSFFGKWRTWEETDRAKAAAAAKPRGQSYRAPTVTFEPTAKHRAYAAKHSLPLDELVKELHTSGAVDDLGAKRALEMLGEKMGRLVREQCDQLIAKQARQGGEAA